MKTKILIVVILLSFISAPIFGQNEIRDIEIETNSLKYSIGFGAGFTTGYGLSFRYTPSKFGVQATLTPIYNDNRTQVSAGVTFMYTLFKEKKTRFYLYQGNHYYFSQYNYSYPSYPSSNVGYFNNGLGVGIEIVILKHIGLNIMGGYASYKNFTELNMTGEAGLYYKF